MARTLTIYCQFVKGSEPLGPPEGSSAELLAPPSFLWKLGASSDALFLVSRQPVPRTLMLWRREPGTRLTQGP